MEKIGSGIMSFGSWLLIAMLSLIAAKAQTSRPLIFGVDHIPLVVSDLDGAEADFRAMGFSIKPGRPHADGIRNAHVKFPDGTEIELITAPRSADILTAEYRAKLKSGEGPVYFGLYTPNIPALGARLHALQVGAEADEGLLGFPPESRLHPLFFGGRNKSPTDLPEHFAHSNSAMRFSAVWVRDSQEMRTLLQNLGVSLAPARHCEVVGASEEVVAALPDGNVYFVPSAAANVVAARVQVRSLVTLKAILNRNSIPAKRDRGCDPSALWVSPAHAHGIWLEFVETKR
jgi:hypothetical protein